MFIPNINQGKSPEPDSLRTGVPTIINNQNVNKLNKVMNNEFGNLNQKIETLNDCDNPAGQNL